MGTWVILANNLDNADFLRFFNELLIIRQQRLNPSETPCMTKHYDRRLILGLMRQPLYIFQVQRIDVIRLVSCLWGCLSHKGQACRR